MAAGRITRATGTEVEIIDTRTTGEFGHEPDNPWATVCWGAPGGEPHNGICTHRTRALASLWAPHPEEWCPDCQDEAGAKEEARGALAGTPELMPCFECGRARGRSHITRKVVALGPVVNPADPTQSYRLACGHTTI